MGKLVERVAEEKRKKKKGKGDTREQGKARKEEKKCTEKIALRGADTGICFFELSFLLSSGHFVEFSRSCVSILDV